MLALTARTPLALEGRLGAPRGITMGMKVLARLLLPVALLAAAVHFFLRAPGAGNVFLAYFVSAMFVGMALAAAQRAWQAGRDKRR